MPLINQNPAPAFSSEKRLFLTAALPLSAAASTIYSHNKRLHCVSTNEMSFVMFSSPFLLALFFFCVFLNEI